MESGNATRLVFVPTEHIFEVVDPFIMRESAEWITESLLGEEEVTNRLSNWTTVYQIKFYSEMVGGVVLALSIIVLIQLLSPNKLFKSELGNDLGKPSNSRPHLLLVIIGVVNAIVWLAVIFLIPSSVLTSMPMFSMSLFAFFIAGVIINAILLLRPPLDLSWDHQRIIRGSQNLVIILLWILIWVGLGSIVEFEPRIVFPLFRWFEPIRAISLVLFIPFASAWFYGQISYLNSAYHPRGNRQMVFLVIEYLLGLASTTIIMIILLTNSGNISGPMFLTGLLSNYFMVGMLFTSIILVVGLHYRLERWSLSILCAIVLVWTVLASSPVV
jgi:hypothetical protein